MVHVLPVHLQTWLKLLKVTDVARESTGIDCMPVWHVLEDQLRDLLEMTGIKLSSVLSNRSGVTRQRMRRALAAGEDSAERLSWKAVEKLRQKAGGFKQAVRAEVGALYRETLGFHLKYDDFVCAPLTELEERIAKLMEPYSAEIALLVTIPGPIVWWRGSSLQRWGHGGVSRCRTLRQLGRVEPGNAGERRSTVLVIAYSMLSGPGGVS